MPNRLVALTALLSLSGCAPWFAATAVDGPTLCRHLASPATAHNRALLDDGGPLSQATGLDLLVVIDAGCDWR